MPSTPTKAAAASPAELIDSAQSRLAAIADHYGEIRLDSEASVAAHGQLAEIEALIAIAMLLTPAA